MSVRSARAIGDDRALFAEVRRRLVEGLRPHKVVVFGSRSRGDAHAESDLDLMVVLEHTGSLAERSRVVRRHLADLGVPVDLVTYTPAEYERFRTWKTSVAAIADREGVVLHG